MCDRVVPEVAVSGARADCGMITEAIEDMVTRWVLRVLAQEGRCEDEVARAVRTRSASQWKGGELDPPANIAPVLGTWCNSKGDPVPLGWIVPSTCPKCVCVTQVGQVTLSACRTIS